MAADEDLEIPTGKELNERWKQLSRGVQGEVIKKARRGETSEDKHEALLIAAMAKRQLSDWVMRPELILPIFVGIMAVLSIVWDDFSFASALTAPLLYAAYMIWMRGNYTRAYRRSVAVLRGDAGEPSSGA